MTNNISKKENAQESSSKSKSKKLLGFLFRSIIMLLLMLFLISISLIFLSQTKSFRSWSVPFIQDKINAGLKGSIEFDDLRFDFFNGIELDEVRVIAAGDTLAYVPSLSLSLNYEKLLDQEVLVNRLVLESPRIKILRSRLDSSWNIANIAFASDDTSSSGPIEWVIKATDLQIKNAGFIFIDSISADFNSGKLEFDRIQLKDLNLELSAVAAPGTEEFSADIHRMSFKEEFSGFILDKMSTGAVINRNGLKLEDANLKIGESNIRITTAIDSINIFENSDDIMNSSISLDLQTDNFDPELVSMILDLPIEIKGKYDIDLICSGTIDNLFVKNLDLESQSIDISLNSMFRNISSDDLSFDVDISVGNINTSILFRDLPGLLPEELKNLEFLNLRNTKVRGSLDSIYAELSAESGAGFVEGFAAVGLAGRDITYKVDLMTSNLNPGKATGIEKLNGKVNSVLRVEGWGTDLKAMQTKLYFKSDSSYLSLFPYKNVLVKVEISPSGKISLDTLKIRFPRIIDSTTFGFEYKVSPALFLNGDLSFSDEKNPEYRLESKFNSLNLKELLNLESAPSMFGGSFSVNSKGLELDSLEGSFNISIDECLFGDRALIPFDINTIFSRNGNNRDLTIESDYLDASIKGNYSYSNLIPSLADHGKYLTKFIIGKIGAISSEFSRDTSISEEIQVKTGVLPELDFYVNADIKDLSPMSLFIDDFHIYLDADLNMHINSGKDKSIFVLDSMIILSFNLESSGSKVISNPMSFNGSYTMILQDSLPLITDLSLSTDHSSELYLNELKISAPMASLLLKGESAEFMASANIEDQLKLGTNGSIVFDKDEIDLDLENISVSYLDSFNWNTSENVSASYKDGALKIESVDFSRDSAETISISGGVKNMVLDDARISIRKFPFSDLNKLNPNPYLEESDGSIEKLDLILNGPLDNPKIEFDLKGKDLRLGESYIGNLKAGLKHINSIITGDISIKSNEKDTTNIVDINIKSLPFSISVDSSKMGFHKNEAVDIYARIGKFPLGIISPFVPGITRLKGQAKAGLHISGYATDQIKMEGFAEFRKANFLVEGTNIFYNAEGRIDIGTNEIRLSDITLSNIKKDYSNGKASIKGVIRHENFNVEDIDLEIRTKGLLVLNDASIKNMPTIFGKFVIANGPTPIHFYGNLEAPVLDGDINILFADLKMPEKVESKISRSAFKYVIKNEDMVILDFTYVPMPEDIIEESEERITKDFADILSYNFNIYFLGKFDIIMEIVGAQLVASIGAKDKTIPLRLIKGANEEMPKIYGGIEVKKESNLKLYKLFKTEGTINFPTGSIENPGLDLTATLSGKSYVAGTSKQYVVTARITGTKNKPFISFSYTLNGEEAIGDSSKIYEDALFLLLVGKTKDDLFSSGTGQDPGALTNTLTALLSTETSKAITELFKGTGVIQNAEIDIAGGDLSDMRLKLTGQLAGDISWTVGGTVADLASNSQISIEIPLTDIFNTFPVETNLEFTGTSNINSASSIDQKDWEIKIKIGHSW